MMKSKTKILTLIALCVVFCLSFGLLVACSGNQQIDANTTSEFYQSGGSEDSHGGSVDSHGGSVDSHVSGKTVTIRFVTGVSGVEVAPISGVSGQNVSAPTSPQADGKLFVCWQLNGNDYRFTVFPENDITLTARWDSFHVVKFDSGNAGQVTTVQVADGDCVDYLNATLEGSVLLGWTYNNKAYDFSKPVTSDLTLMAKWAERTNLPTLIIDLFDNNGNTYSISTINAPSSPADNPVTSNISLLNGDGDYIVENGPSTFKGRGNGSWSKPKKGYKIKFDKKQSLFGRVANKHWVIIPCQNFPDGSMLINYTAYNTGDQIFDNIEYSSNAVWVDVYVNGEYYGVYDLCEHIRVAEGRVDIESEYGVDDTGYLIELDSTASSSELGYFTTNSAKFMVHSPSPEDYETDGKITRQQYQNQVNYIKNYVGQVYSAASSHNYNTFSQLADVDSLVDMYIIEEFYKNSDVGHASFYMYKKKGGKLYFGPPWDFDWAANHSSDQARSSYPGDDDATNFPVANGTKNANAILVEMCKVSQFIDKVKARWAEISPKLQTYFNNLFTEQFYAANRYALGKNFVKWPWPENTKLTQANAETSWISECRKLKTWFDNRINWLNTYQNQWGQNPSSGSGSGSGRPR